MEAAQIDFAVVIDVIEIVFEFAIEAEELIAAGEILWRAKIDEFYLVGGAGVAHGGEGEVAVVDDFIEEFFGELGVGDGFDRAGGLEACGVEGGGDGGAK